MNNFISLIVLLISFSGYGSEVPDHFHHSNITNSGLQGTSKLSLTFDDGPTSESTKSILDSLKLYNVNGFSIEATFFVVGKMAKSTRGLEALQRMKDEGHIVASHSYSHKNLAKGHYSIEKNIFYETEKVHKVISDFLPSLDELDKKWYFRAPYGAWQKQRAENLNKHNVLKNYVGPIGWDIGSINRRSSKGALVRAADWQCWSEKISIEYCALGYIREALEKDGGVVLLHDIHSKTAEMFKYLLVTWTGVNLFGDEKYSVHSQQQNYAMEFVNLDEIKSYDQFDDRLNPKEITELEE